MILWSVKVDEMMLTAGWTPGRSVDVDCPPTHPVKSIVASLSGLTVLLQVWGPFQRRILFEFIDNLEPEDVWATHVHQRLFGFAFDDDYEDVYYVDEAGRIFSSHELAPEEATFHGNSFVEFIENTLDGVPPKPVVWRGKESFEFGGKKHSRVGAEVYDLELHGIRG